MDTDVTKYLGNLNDEQLGLFWIIASASARQWIAGELTRRAKARGEVVMEPSDRRLQMAVAAA
jgi:hypothetical protein